MDIHLLLLGIGIASIVVFWLNLYKPFMTKTQATINETIHFIALVGLGIFDFMEGEFINAGVWITLAIFWLVRKYLEQY